MPTPWKTEEIKNESDFEILLRDRSVIAKGVNAETSVSKLDVENHHHALYQRFILPIEI